MTKIGAGLLRSPMLWVAVPVLAAVTAGSAYVVVQHNNSQTSILHARFVANGSGTTTTAAVKSSPSPAPSPTATTTGTNVNNNNNGNTHSFTLSGTVSGLGPGHPVQLPVLVDNRQNTAAMQVMSISGTVGTPTHVGTPDSTHPACVASYVVVTPYKYQSGMTAITIPAYSTGTVKVWVTFTDTTTNQDTCKGAIFPITLTGTGQQA